MNKLTVNNEIKINYQTIYTFDKIIKYAELPYNFDQINKFWWRWYSDIYGFYYNRVKRSYSLWLTTFLKKNIGVYMPFFFKMTNKRSKLLDNWRRRSFLYTKTLLNKINKINQLSKLDFWLIDYNQLSEAAKEVVLPGNREHRQLNSFGLFGLEINMFISSYNAKWNNLYKHESLFFNNGRMPKDFLIIINSFFISSGFFINSYDSLLTLYPQYYLIYYNKLFTKKFNNILLFFNVRNNIIFYINIILLISLLYLNLIQIKLSRYLNLTLFNSFDFNIYKLNIYIHYLRYLKFFYKKILNINSFYLYSIFYNIFDLNKVILLKNINNVNKQNLFNFVYFTYFTNKIKLESDRKINKYNFLFKYLYKLQTNYNNLYLKKLYITEWIYLWEILNDNNINFKNMKRQRQSQYFINKYKILLKNKYEKVKDLFSIIEYLQNLKIKFLNYKTNKNFIMIKPSIKIKRSYLISKLTWITSYGKHFTTIPYKYEKKNIAYFFTNSLNKFRFISYVKYTKLLLIKIKNFLIKFYTILINNLKINFGFSYTILSPVTKNILYKNLFSYNLQYYIYIYFLFIKQYFRSKYDFCNIKNIFNIQQFNTYDIKFYKLLYFSIKNYKKKISYKKFFTSKYKGINLNNFTYIKFLKKL